MFKPGQRVQMVSNCKDNGNIKEGFKGKVDYVSYNGSISVEFESPVIGNGISGNGRNGFNWFVNPEQLETI